MLSVYKQNKKQILHLTANLIYQNKLIITKTVLHKMSSVINQTLQVVDQEIHSVVTLSYQIKINKANQKIINLL